MDGWIKIYSSDQPVQIEIAKSILSDHDIESVSISKKDSSYIFGDIELYVKSENSAQAVQLITMHNL